MLRFNNNEISESDGNVNFNGNALETVNFNSDEVWHKGSAPSVVGLCFTNTGNDSLDVYLVNVNCTRYTDEEYSELLEYTTDGVTWTPYNYDKTPDAGSASAPGYGFEAVTLAPGERVWFRNAGTHTGYFSDQSSTTYLYFYAEGNSTFDLSGDASTLLHPDGNWQDAVQAYTFCRLFNYNDNLVHAHELEFPTLNLSASGNGSSYQRMFQECTSLETAPELPATTLCSYCYRNMFNGCTSLTQAPSVLSCTTLPQYAYDNMFVNCTSLEKAPKLVEATFTANSYANMFSGCTSLNYINCEIKSYSASAFSNWTLGVAEEGTFKVKYQETIDNFPHNSANGIPTNWIIDDSNFFYVEAAEDNVGIALLMHNSPEYVELETSSDGETWEDYFITNYIWLENTGDKAYFRNKSTETTAFSSEDGQYVFSSTGNVKVGGKIMTLLNRTGSGTLPEVSGDNVNAFIFARLFQNGEEEEYDFSNDVSVTDASALVFPSNTTSNCYQRMFMGNEYLTAAPVLPAMTADRLCYLRMFQGCTSLVTPPALPATTLTYGCYSYMFYQCSSLYMGEFTQQSGSLPATTLAEYCYRSMYADCTSLEAAPVLPAKVSAEAAYKNMFRNCSSLIAIECLLEDRNATEVTAGWTTDAGHGTGKFVASQAGYENDIWSAGGDGVPSGWVYTYRTESFYFENVGATSANIQLYSRTSGNSTLEYSTTPGGTYTTLAYNTNVTVPTGGKLYVRCINNTLTDINTSSTALSAKYFKMTGGDVAARGRISYLVKQDGKVTTSLGSYCFFQLFRNCTTLVASPEINVAPNGSSCFREMFSGCTQLAEITVNITTSWTSQTNWVNNVKSTGTFYKPVSLSISTGTGGIPSGWTVVNI